MQALRVAMALGFGLFAVGVSVSGQDSDRNVSRESIGLQTTRDGYLPGAEVESEARPRSSSATACFQLHKSGLTWFVNAELNLDFYPYPVTGGTISGAICDSPNWQLTGGLVGPDLIIKGHHVGPGFGCVERVTIRGRFGPPAGYAGAYRFDKNEHDHDHRILFLGFDHPCGREPQ